MTWHSRAEALRRRLPPAARRLVDALDVEALMMLGVLLVGVLAALAFIALAGEVVEGDTQQIDEAIVRWFRDPAHPGRTRGPDWLISAALDITALGSASVLIFLVVTIAGFLWMHEQFRLLLLLVLSLVGGNILNMLMKLQFARPRPDVVPHLSEVVTYSFPSGHAAMSAIVYLTIGLLLFEFVTATRARLYCLAVAMLVTLLVGSSRVFLGVHYPSDVLAGWATGISWVALCWVGTHYLKRRRAS